MFFLKYFITSSLYVKVAIILLFVMVIITLTMALTKFKRIRYISSYIKSFEETFWSGISLDDFYHQNSENLNHPLGMIFKSVYEEWEASENIRTNVYNKQDIKERMLNVANVQKLKILHTCEKYLDTLELFIKSDPFVGLFGTIIGMIEVFYNIDLQNGLNILSTATGIGEALLCVMASVVVALLSMLIHWWFNGRLRDVGDKVDGFIVDVINIFARNLDGLATDNAPIITHNNTQQTTQQTIVQPDVTNNIVKESTSDDTQGNNNNNESDDLPKAKPAKKAKPIDDDI